MKFLRPTCLTELAECLAGKPEGTYLVAGCTDFLAKRNGKSWEAEALLSLTDVAEMKDIVLNGDKLSIGASCTHSHIEENELVRKYFPALALACGDVGSKQIRNRGTIGGNVGNASPAGDTFPVLRCLGAQAVLFNSKGEIRRLPMDELVLGIEKTALAADEVILAFELPVPAANNVNAFIKLGDRPKVTIAKINLAISLELENGIIRSPMVTLGAVAQCAFPAADAMAALDSRPLSRDLFPALAQALSDEIRRSIPTRASMPYKHKAVAGLADSILDILVQQAQAKGLI